MPARAEVLHDGSIGGEEPLGLTRRLKPWHTPLALPSRLMGVFCPVIELAVLTMVHPGEDLALGSTIALQLVGDEHARDVG